MSKRVLVPISRGFEEIEALCVVDILRRAGVEVVLACLEEERTVMGRSGIQVIADQTLSAALAAGPYDLVVLPGGLPNAHALCDDERVIACVQGQLAAGAWVAAICAAPLALQRAGVLEGLRLTSHPSVRDQLPGDRYSEDRVVVDGRVVTSRAAGTALEFAFTLVRLLVGAEAVLLVNAGVLADLGRGDAPGGR